MKVLLANPESDVWNSRNHLPLGLGYLGAALEQAGHTVEIWDGAVETTPFSHVLQRGRFDLVGITATTPVVPYAWKLAGEAKSAGLPTVFGGPHATLMPEESLNQPEIDLVFQGEGEAAIVQIVAALEQDQGKVNPHTGIRTWDERVWHQVHGLLFRNHAGDVVRNPPAPLPQDLDAIPFPAHHLFKLDRYTNLNPVTDGLDPKARAFTIMTSRGCPYQCIYCSKPVTGDTWRGRSPENVVKEWAWLVRDMGATEIGVTDDIWNLKLDRAKEICRQIVQAGVNTVPWVTVHGMKVNHVDQELFDLMKAAGCKRVGFGVEAGNAQVLKDIRKSQTLAQIRQAFACAKKAGIQTMGFFILGLPTDTEATMEETIRLALELDPELANFMISTPFPGTELYNIVQRDGQILAHDWSDFAIHEQKARYTIGALTAEMVERKWHEAYRRFYLRPNRLIRRAFKWDTWRRLPTYVADARRFFLGTRIHDEY